MVQTEETVTVTTAALQEIMVQVAELIMETEATETEATETMLTTTTEAIVETDITDAGLRLQLRILDLTTDQQVLNELQTQTAQEEIHRQEVDEQ